MTEHNVGDREAFVRPWGTIFLFAFGLGVPFETRLVVGIPLTVVSWAAALLLFKSAQERYCPIHDACGIDTT